MSLFNEINDAVNSQSSPYLSKGINEDVTIGSITLETPDTGAPYISIMLHKSSSSPEQGTTFRMYMSDAARPKTLEKITHLATKVITKESLLAINNDSKSIEEFCNKLNAVLEGKTIKWFKFTAEQYLNGEGKLRDRLKIGLPPFASQEKESKLKFDESNKYDYVPLTEVTTASPKTRF